MVVVTHEQSLHIVFHTKNGLHKLAGRQGSHGLVERQYGTFDPTEGKQFYFFIGCGEQFRHIVSLNHDTRMAVEGNG